MLIYAREGGDYTESLPHGLDRPHLLLCFAGRYEIPGTCRLKVLCVVGVVWTRFTREPGSRSASMMSVEGLPRGLKLMPKNSEVLRLRI